MPVSQTVSPQQSQPETGCTSSRNAFVPTSLYPISFSRAHQANHLCISARAAASSCVPYEARPLGCFQVSNSHIHSAIASHNDGHALLRSILTRGKLFVARTSSAACTSTSSVAVNVRQFLFFKASRGRRSTTCLFCSQIAASYHVLRNRRIILHDWPGASSRISGHGSIHSSSVLYETATPTLRGYPGPDLGQR